MLVGKIQPLTMIWRVDNIWLQCSHYNIYSLLYMGMKVHAICKVSSINLSAIHISDAAKIAFSHTLM